MNQEEMLMRPDEYRVMFETEDRYWWYRGLRTLLQGLAARYAQGNGAPLKILDAGCGTGANLQLLQAYGRAIGIDLSEQAIRFCRGRGLAADRALVGSVTELPFPNSYFDLAVSFDVLCNVPDEGTAFAELARVLKPGGRLIVQLPAYQWLWSAHDVAVGHQRRYSAHGLSRTIARAGLEPERVTHTNAFFLPFAVLTRWVRRAHQNGNDVCSDLVMPIPRWLNDCFSAVIALEMRAVSRVNLPVGLSVLVVARKK